MFNNDEFCRELAHNTSLLTILGQVLNLPDDADKIDEEEVLSWSMQMKLHSIQCLINIYSLPEMIMTASNLLEDVIQHVKTTMDQFVVGIRLEKSVAPKISVEMLECCFYLVANFTAESNEVAIQILQRTSLIEAMEIASTNEVCSSKMLKTLVWLASLLMHQHTQLGLTRNDKLKLCSIGKKGIQTIDDSIISDGCWLFAYAFDTTDDTFLVEVCSVVITSCLVRLLKASD